jgi:hypothetical protein
LKVIFESGQSLTCEALPLRILGRLAFLAELSDLLLMVFYRIRRMGLIELRPR